MFIISYYIPWFILPTKIYRFVKVHRKLFFALFSKDVINLTKFCRLSVTNLVIGTVICFFKNLHLLYTNLSMVWMKCNEIRKPFLNNGLVLKKLKLHVSHLFWCVYRRDRTSVNAHKILHRAIRWTIVMKHNTGIHCTCPWNQSSTYTQKSADN